MSTHTSIPSFRSFEIPPVPLMLVVIVLLLTPLGVRLLSSSLVVAVVEIPDVVGIVTDHG